MDKQQKKKKTAAIIASIVVVIWLVIGAGFFGAWVSSNYANSKNQNFIDGSSKVDGNTVVSADEADLANVIKKVSPSVVSIVVKQTSGSGYFQTESEGAGTGIVISSNGYVLTNKHVIDGMKSASIVMSDGTVYSRVNLVGTDPLNDIAFLKIQDAKDLSVASFGDSSTVRVGQNVVAIGNSLGQYQNTVTSGIISGLSRPVMASSDRYGNNVESLNDLIQTDAAINPGNSGGPLINMAGQVIGINTAIASDAQGIGFAIPINATKGLVSGVLKDGTVRRAYVGVQYIDITSDVRAEYKLSVSQGALIKSTGAGQTVASGGPAEKAGVREGDIITKVNDRTVGEQGGLSSIIGEFSPGDKVEMTLLRDGKTKNISLTLGEYKG